MPEIEKYPRDYLGDGVYAEFDGSGIWLRINDFNDPTDTAYLEPEVLRSLINFADRVGMKY